MIGWAKVLKILYLNHRTIMDLDNPTCTQSLVPTLSLALSLSFLELVNALIGATRSKPLQVLLFSVVRFGTEVIVGSMIPCGCWQHIMTVFFWSFGDTIRFGCFVLDALAPGGRVARAVRYTAGPVLFPFGATGEMLMVIAAAQNDRPAMYIAAALWPIGFYPLFTQLLRQRRKFFRENFGNAQKAKAS